MSRRREKTVLGPMIIAGVVGALAALWTWTAPGDPALWPGATEGPGVEISLLDNGFHTDLAVPRAALEARGGPLAEAVKGLPPGNWILIGWGDAKFYVDQSPISDRLPDGARAFFRPGNPSVIMLDPTQRDPRQTFAEEGRRDFRLSDAAFAAMAAHVEASLDLSSGAPRLAAARAGDGARFFASREHFGIGHLCNHWTAGALNAAGMETRPVQAILSSEVVATVDRANATRR
ncbi:DUF2459 domain-containing protein [Brevundimonas sp.]|uniref:DUF2459 domain-containing protein n=1 Tax=Brevundimonas sp. TaxID=1871086 RepID=UPI003F719EDB